MRYFLHLAYDGSFYRGWQYQPNVPSVQEVIEKKLAVIFKEKLTLFGCGRTDAGVHASQYFAHIQPPQPIDFDLAFRLNKHLPDTIYVYEVLEMDGNEHARYDAIVRTYDYFLHLFPDPFLERYSTYCGDASLDLEAMQQAAELLPKYTDFKTLCRKPHLYKHTLCKVSESQLIVNKAQNRLRFTITSNRFLQGMIRLCVHYFLRIGRGEMKVEEFDHLLANQQEEPIKRPAPPNGLYLSKVEYPYLKVESKNQWMAFLKRDLEG